VHLLQIVPHPFYILVETNILFLQSFDFAHLRHETLFALRSRVSNKSRSKASSCPGCGTAQEREEKPIQRVQEEAKELSKAEEKLRRSDAPRKVLTESRMTRRCSSAEHQTI
jgi:hypothetical protein